MGTGIYPDSAGPYDADGMAVCNIVFVVALLALGGGGGEEAVDQRERAVRGTRGIDR